MSIKARPPPISFVAHKTTSSHLHLLQSTANSIYFPSYFILRDPSHLSSQDMNQPAGPSSGAEDHGAERDSTELDFFLDRLPLKERVFLYHKSIGTDGWSIQHLVYLKTRRATNESQATKDFDVNEQKRVAARVSAIFKQRSWEVSEENWGRYAASGMTEENDFDLCFHVTDQEATKIQCGNGTLVGSNCTYGGPA